MASQDKIHADGRTSVTGQINDPSERKGLDGPGEVTVERVFPIRIQVPNRQQAPGEKSNPASQIVGDIAHDVLGPAAHNRPNILLSQSELNLASPLVSTAPISEGSPSSSQRYVTDRFTYLPPADASTTSLIGQKIYRCEDEPIHIPGAIQRLGVLIAIREEGGFFLVRVVSENSQSVTGLEPNALFELRCFTDLLSKADRTELLIRIQALLANGLKNSGRNLDVFAISLTRPLEAPISLYCAMHLELESGLIICEFEAKKDIINPTNSPDNGLPEQPFHIIDYEATEPERVLSTTSKSKPLHTLQIARASSRQLALMDLFQIHSEIQAQLLASTELSALLDVVVGLVHDLTGFHRVMVYQFDETAAGSVVSEIIDPRASADLYRGLHFPASDIPKQARELYVINTIRILYDRTQDTARLMCRTFDDAKVPLNLKHSYLRAMSPVHLRYLANMGVQASMSISIIVNQKLWGLISCHNYGSAAGMRISLPIREVCKSLGNIASSHVEKLLFSSRILARRLLSKAPPKTSPFAYITSSTSDLLSMFGADFGFLVIRGEARTIGRLCAYSESIVLLQYIRQRAFTMIFYTQAIQNDCTDLEYPLGLTTISGMLVIPLALSGTDFLVFFRKGQLKEINWAGNPYEKLNSPGTSHLEPRNSFKRWSENVVGTSREWTEDEVESATVLTTLYGRFIDVWRQKEAIVQQNRMTRLLIQNAGHEVRTPLNSIINYLEVALEEALDEGARLYLQKSLQASKSLVSVVNDLLNLTEAEEVGLQLYEDNVDLTVMIAEVVAAFKDEAMWRNLNVQVEHDLAVPRIVRCDPSGLRQSLSNLLANAVQSSDNGNIYINLEHIKTTEASSLIKISFKDEGIGLSEHELDNIFQNFEQILDDDRILDEVDEEKSHPRPLQIGLGLAIVARFVRVNFGQIGMSSEGRGKGATVSITMPFRKALAGRLEKLQLSTDHSFPNIVSDISSRSLGTPSDSLPSPQPLETISPSLSTPGSSINRYPFPATASAHEQRAFNVLVAEDNPLNSRLLDTRLKRRGDTVQVATNGKACFAIYKNSSEAFDIILMDIQMPLVDGIEATRMIREVEKECAIPTRLSQRAAGYGRIPIIAVSASLSEHRVHEYIDAGFDGWIMKPIDFKRLEAIITAIEDEQMRQVLLYGSESWEKGGWFKIQGNSSTKV